ncbi:hypothetical protein Ancab_037725 [Ancistrocladus abbreviatus]
MVNSNWSAENATRAYLKSLKMGKGGGKEPDVAEFISALAGGNNAQLMVEVCGGRAGPTTLALVAAAHQTGGRVVCILPSREDLQSSRIALGRYSNLVELVAEDAATLLVDRVYRGADFVLINSDVEDHEVIFRAAQMGGRQGGGRLVVGYNAHDKVSLWRELNGHFLPIGDGLVVARVPSSVTGDCDGGGVGGARIGKRSRWVVKVDSCTGEEHVFRITSPQQKAD